VLYFISLEAYQKYVLKFIEDSGKIWPAITSIISIMIAKCAILLVKSDCIDKYLNRRMFHIHSKITILLFWNIENLWNSSSFCQKKIDSITRMIRNDTFRCICVWFSKDIIFLRHFDYKCSKIVSNVNFFYREKTRVAVIGINACLYSMIHKRAIFLGKNDCIDKYHRSIGSVFDHF
jgi:hypothetical protein